MDEHTPTAKRITAAELPSLYTDHILIERTRAGTYRLSGRSTLSPAGVAHLSTLAMTLDGAIKTARRWASDHNAPTIFVCE